MLVRVISWIVAWSKDKDDPRINTKEDRVSLKVITVLGTKVLS
jgi:hypothetical protein